MNFTILIFFFVKMMHIFYTNVKKYPSSFNVNILMNHKRENEEKIALLFYRLLSSDAEF